LSQLKIRKLSISKTNLNRFPIFLQINWAGFPLVTCGNGCDNQDCDAHNTIPPSSNLLTLINMDMLFLEIFRNLSMYMFFMHMEMLCTTSLVPMTKKKKPAKELTKFIAAMNATSRSLCCCGTHLQT